VIWSKNKSVIYIQMVFGDGWGASKPPPKGYLYFVCRKFASVTEKTYFCNVNN
jgi:hypothetical protein